MISYLLLAGAFTAMQLNVFEIPANSPFKLQKAEAQYGSPASFSGEITIQAEYAFEWRIIDDAPDTLEMHIFASHEDMSRFLFDKKYPSKQLYVVNPEAVAGILMSPKDKQDLLNAKTLRRTGVATFYLADLSTAIDCDSRSYGVRVVSAIATNKMAETIYVPTHKGC